MDVKDVNQDQGDDEVFHSAEKQHSPAIHLSIANLAEHFSIYSEFSLIFQFSIVPCGIVNDNLCPVFQLYWSKALMAACTVLRGHLIQNVTF